MDSRSRATEQEKNKSSADVLVKLEAYVPERYRHLVKAVAKGNLQKAVKLHCLDCCGYQVEEVKNCRCFTCSLWSFRPFDLSKEDDSCPPVKENSRSRDNGYSRSRE